MASKEQELIIRIAGKVDPTLKSALSVVNSGIKGATKVLTSATAAGVAAVGAIGAASVKVGKEFESSMSTLAATAGLDTATAQGAADFEQLEAAARAMGRETTKTASEAADALTYMALAGWDVETSCSALEPVLRLSEATELDLATTSDLVTDSMSAMGLTVDELSNYLDVCAAANNNSNQTAQQMMEAMIGAGGAARTAGLSYTDTATALGVLANNGIKGSEAGTALNSMLVRISTNSSAASAFQDLGVAVYDSAGQMRGLQDILVDTSAALDGMTDSQKNSYLSAIAGKAYYSDFQYLLNGVSEDVDGLGTAWDQLSYELANCDGALQSMAQTKTDTLEGDMSRLTSAASDLGISIYKGINEPLRDMSKLGAEVMGSLSAAFDEGGFSGMVNEISEIMPQAVETIGQYVPQMIGMGQELATAVIQGIGNSAPQIATVAAQSISTFVQGAAQMLPALGTTGVQVILAFVQSMIPELPMIFQTATNGIVQFIQGIGANLPAILQTGFQLILALIEGIIQSLPQIAAAGVQLVGELIMTILNTDWVEVGTSILTSIGSGLVNGVKGIGGSLVNGVKGLFGGADVSSEGVEATETYAAGIEAGSSIVTAAATDMTASAFANLDYSVLTTAGMDGTEAFSAGLLDNIDIVTSAGDELGAELTGSFNTTWTDINSGAVSAMAEMSSTLTTESQAAANAVKQAFEGMTITIPKPKVPVITTTYRTETYGEGGSIQIPQFNVSWNKLGGIFDDPTILQTAQGLQGVGEAGPEAILPLDTLWTKMESILSDILARDRGTNVIDSLLAKLDSATNGGQPEYAVAGGGTITYSPVFNLYGSAGKEEVMEAEKDSYAEFEKMMNRWKREQARTRF